MSEIDVDRPNTELKTYKNGRCKCSACGETMPAEKLRITFGYKTSYGGSSAKRVCEDCIMAYALQIRRKRLKH